MRDMPYPKGSVRLAHFHEGNAEWLPQLKRNSLNIQRDNLPKIAISITSAGLITLIGTPVAE